MKQIVIIIILLISFTSEAQSLECKDVQNGKFKYFDPKSNEVIITRKDSIQIDSCKAMNLIIHSKIRWKSDCEYEMTILKVSDSLLNFVIGNTFKLNITDIVDRKVHLNSLTLNGKRTTKTTLEILELF